MFKYLLLFWDLEDIFFILIISENILLYFRTFRIHIPKKSDVKIEPITTEDRPQQLLEEKIPHQEQK